MSSKRRPASAPVGACTDHKRTRRRKSHVSRSSPGRPRSVGGAGTDNRRRVALIVESSLASGRQTLRGFAEYVRRVNCWSIYYEPGHFQTSLPDWLHNWRGDGVVARVRNPIVARQLAKLRVPVVDISGNVPDTGFPIVQVDNRAIARLAASHLLEHGFRGLAFCGIRGQWWSRLRQEVFEEIVGRSACVWQAYQLPRMGGQVWFSESERRRLAQWIAGLPKPIGIMAANDWAGQKVLAACRRAGTMVPEEVAVLGVDNDEAICEISDPMLSSIDARHDRVGFHAAELLDQLLHGKTPPREPVAAGLPTIVVRRSTDMQSIADRDVAEAVRYIREHACGEICVERVAAHVALSYTTLKRRFRRLLARSVHDEITRVRVERVRELLTETEMTLTEIARAAGFRHQAYFGAVFKSQTGMTPGEFRQENAIKSS
jgi:LacI family transcriptional regulator